MKAVYFEKHGGLEVLRYGERPDPVPGPTEALIAVKACALNHLDIWVRSGMPGASIPLPHIPGSDVSGTVLETGKDVRRSKPGDRVVISPGQHPDNYSPEFRILGLQTQGGYAEKVCVPEAFIIPVSEKYSFEEWASLPLTSLTAYHMLVTRAGLKNGESVLIHAGGSGVGSSAIQLAKHLGARVFTTVGDAQKAVRAKTLGAAEVILYRQEDFSEKVKSLTGGRGVDVVFEHIGPEVWQKSLASLTRGGRLVTCGATSGGKVETDLRFLYSKQLSILGSYMGNLAELIKVLELAQSGVLRPVLDRTFPLKEAAAAQERMESRKNFGKIVLTV